MRIILPLISLAWTIGANAAPCEAVIPPALAQAFPTATFGDDNPTQFALPGKEEIHGKVLGCRVWPGNAELALIAVALDREDTSSELPQAGIDILVVDSASGALRMRRHEPEVFGSTRDPSSPVFYQFDAAHYRLSPDRLAFGLRLGRGTRQAGEGLLRLYVRDGDKLEPVVELVTSQLISFRGLDSSDKAQCREAKEDLLASPDIRRTVAIGQTRSHGLADLHVNETRTPHSLALECGAKIRPVSKRYTFKFDGRRYVLLGAAAGEHSLD